MEATILSIGLAKSEREWIPTHLLMNLAQNIGSVFFPFPGKIVVSPSRREKTQWGLLQKSEANINIEEFIWSDSTLKRDKMAKGGCLGTALLLLFCFILIFSIILLVVNL